ARVRRVLHGGAGYQLLVSPERRAADSPGLRDVRPAADAHERRWREHGVSRDGRELPVAARVGAEESRRPARRGFRWTESNPCCRRLLAATKREGGGVL